MIRLWQVKRGLSRLLVRLGIRKQGVMVPSAFPELFKPDLQEGFKMAYDEATIKVGPDLGQGSFMCGNCSLVSSDLSEILDHDCPGPPPRPVNDEPDFCPECGRAYEDD